MTPLVRRALLAATLVVAGGAVPVAQAVTAGSTTGATAVRAPGPGGFSTANVTWLKNIPVTTPGVSGRVVKVGDQVRFYMSEAKGLHIYDVTAPANPVELGFLPLPHLQNEDVEVSADGRRVIIGADGALFVRLNANPGIHVIDASNPAAPKKIGFHADPQHTTSCADPACDWLYGSEGQTYDLRDPAAPKKVMPGWQAHIAAEYGVSLSQGAHDFSRDAAGLVSADTVPRVLLDPRADPAKPVVVTTGSVPRGKQLAYQHNSTRPRALEWQARAEGDDNGEMRPGELLIANGETNLKPRCSGTNGPIATWDIRNFDRGEPMQPLSVFRPVANGTYADGNPAANVYGCSGHYFDERKNVLATAWFEHGVRFVSVDPASGSLAEIGWWQPVVGASGAAYWVDDEHVYVTDYERGLDILRFDRSAPAATTEELKALAASAEQVRGPAPVSAVAERERYACRLS